MVKRTARTKARSTHSRPGQSNLVRIIGGEHGGRKLRFPDGRGLRPTSDRVRETLFNWLQPLIPGAQCLDLFAGSGALGLEALSRGASAVTMLDTNTAVFQQLKENVELLGVTNRADIQLINTLEWLSQDGEPYDIVFLDPPFDDDVLSVCARKLEANGWLGDGARIYIEQGFGCDYPVLPECWQLLKQKRAGQVDYRLYTREK